MTANPNKPLIAYIRQSRSHEHTISVEEQRRSIRAWAKAHDAKLGEEIVEQDVSGNKAWREREIGRAIGMCEEGRAGGIIVAWQDRLSREQGLATAEVWDALGNAEARLVVTEEGLDTETGDHEMLFTIKGAIAREGWKRHRSNWRKAKHNAWERGIYAAAAPAGFTKPVTGTDKKNGRPVYGTLEADARYASAVTEAFVQRARGDSYAVIAKALTAAAVPTAHKVKGTDEARTVWNVPAVRSLLGSRTYLGEHACSCGCGEVRKDAHPALVDEVTYLRATHRKGTVRKAREDRHVPLLSGVLKCGTCGYGMSLDGTTKGRDGKVYRYYRCKANAACPQRVTCAADAVEQHLIAEALTRRSHWVVSTASDIDPALQDAVTEAEAGVRDVEELRGKLKPAIYAAARQDAEDALDEARAALIAATPDTDLGRWMRVEPDVLFTAVEEGLDPEDPRQPVLRWEARDPHVARAFLRGMLGTVAVAAGRAPLEQKLTVADAA